VQELYLKLPDPLDVEGIYGLHSLQVSTLLWGGRGAHGALGACPLAMPPVRDRTPGPLALRSARLDLLGSRPRALALLGFYSHLGSPGSRLPLAAPARGSSK
jgi:hypothetical protein